MAVKTAQYAGPVPDTNRGPSQILWAAPGAPGAWIADYVQDPSLGFSFYDEFDQGAPSAALGSGATTGTFGKWGLYGFANATTADASTPFGGLNLVCGTTSHQGIALTSLGGVVQFYNSTASTYGTYTVFEARVGTNFATSTAASAADIFVGLCDQGAPASGQPITTTNNSLYNGCNLIGFHRKGSVGNDWQFVYQASGVAAVYPTNLQTLVSTVTGSALVNYASSSPVSTSFKLGFVFNPNPVPQLMSVTTTGNSALVIARPLIQVFVNGKPAAAFLTTLNVSSSNFPSGIMSPAIAIMNSSTATGVSAYVDFIRLALSAS